MDYYSQACTQGDSQYHEDQHQQAQHESSVSSETDINIVIAAHTCRAQEVIGRIEDAVASILELMDEDRLPLIQNDNFTKKFTLTGCKSLTSILLVLSYCHSLLQHHRSTTTREVYYFYVTHFRHQRDCEQAIWDTSNLLGVTRMSLGLTASPKGWFCGSLHISKDNGTVIDAESLSSMQGLPVTKEWLDGTRDFQLTTTAKCILVIEKEGIYNRLSEDKIFHRFPCILVTGKGFPDVATRALVHSLHRELKLPVYGVCDCNPYGMGVLHCYFKGSARVGSAYDVPIQWLGLRPSTVYGLRDKLPQDVHQSLTDRDTAKLQSFLHESHDFCANAPPRLYELHTMQTMGYKMELEALQWMGMNYICEWLLDVLTRHHNGEKGLII